MAEEKIKLEMRSRELTEEELSICVKKLINKYKMTFKEVSEKTGISIESVHKYYTA